MNKFEKQLEKWNNGVLRGAQAKLAKKLGVSTATTALWATGKRRPSKGYAAQIAALFKMDIYNVFKLFDNSPVIYPTPNISTPHFLCEKEHDFTYFATENSEEPTIPQSNSIQIPFFNDIPKDFPHYDEDEVLEWWSIPRRYASGSKYIIPSKKAGLPHASSETDLCFIKPTMLPAPRETVLYLLNDGSYVCGKFMTEHTIKGLTSYQAENINQIIGVIVRRISSPK